MPHKRGFYINLIVALVLLASIAPVSSTGSAAPLAQDGSTLGASQAQGDLRGFHLVAPGAGWLLLGESLYWTVDNGISWTDITPTVSTSASIHAVSFLDSESGYAVLIGQDDAELPVYSLAQTVNGGAAWQTTVLSLFTPDEPAAQAGAVYLDFLDPQTGWIMVKQATGVNFSLGALFSTTDGGLTWTRLEAPIGAPVYFASATTGWIAGGQAGDQLYRTQDGGRTWTSQALTPISDTTYLYQLPVFTGPQEGLLPVGVNNASGSRIDFYQSSDGGQTWALASTAGLDQALSPGVEPPLSILSKDDWLLVDGQSQSVLSSHGETQSSISTAPGALPDGIVSLDMLTSTDGWALYANGDCSPAPDDMLACRSSTGLLSTSDGGKNWTPLALPGSQIASLLPSNVQLVTGQGFDSCTTPTLSQMQDWMSHSPYRFWNLYLGGASLYPACGTSLNASYINYLSTQGWKFIAIWVGPQAPCFSSGTKMSTNPATAYSQGVHEADLAMSRATNLQLILPNQSGGILYYDLEAYNTNDSTCQTAANNFVAGWTAELKARGNQAGVYSVGRALKNFVSIPPVPDAVWIASYIKSSYASDVTVWGTFLADNLWQNHQRLLQYAGGHNEKWGSTTLNINSDVADGPVINLGGPAVAQISSPADSAWLGSNQTIPVTVTSINPSFVISRVVFQWHDANWSTTDWHDLGTDTNGGNGWSVNFTTTSGLCGQRGIAFYATVYNAAGDHRGYGVWNIGVDCNPPSTTVNTTTWYSGNPFRDFRVVWSGTDAETSVTAYDIQYKDGSNGTWTNLVTNTTATAYDFFPGAWSHTYYFRIRGYDLAGNQGAWTTSDVHYTVPSATCSATADSLENDDSVANARLMAVDGPSAAHNIDAEGDVDWVKFVVPGWSSVRIITNNTGGFGDTVLYLYRSDGTTLLASNDDYSGLNMGSRIDWAFATGGTYYIKVTHFDPYASGCKTTYSITINSTISYWMVLPYVRR